MITNYLPKFKVMEVNNLTGLRCGHMLAQTPADAALAMKTVGEAKFIENGIICGLSASNTVENYDYAKHPCMFVHYTEELNTFLNDLEYFAVEVDERGVAYPRCIALYVGDTFTTNNYVGDLANAKYAKVVDGVLNLQAAADNDSAFIVSPGTMPNGDEGAEFMLYRYPTAAAVQGN